MSYEKTTWVTGDTITAEKLNKIESGIENNSIMIVRSILSTQNYSWVLDKTWQEMYDFTNNDGIIFIITEDQYDGIQIELVTTITSSQNTYYYIYGSLHFQNAYQTNSPNGYPSMASGD